MFDIVLLASGLLDTDFISSYQTFRNVIMFERKDKENAIFILFNEEKTEIKDCFSLNKPKNTQEFINIVEKIRNL